RARLLRFHRQWRFALLGISIHLPLELRVPHIAFIQSSFQVVVEFNLLPMHSLEATGQVDPLDSEPAQINIIASAYRCDDEPQPLCIWWHGTQRRMPVAKLVKPPVEVAASVSAGCLVKAADCQESFPAAAMEFFSDLGSRCPTADHEHCAGR